MRLSNRLYNQLERVYFAQRRIRQVELQRRVAEQDARLRRWAREEEAAHDAGTCGGPGRCPYHPKEA